MKRSVYRQSRGTQTGLENKGTQTFGVRDGDWVNFSNSIYKSKVATVFVSIKPGRLIPAQWTVQEIADDF